jgi:DNA oxidative demethylase
MAARMPITTVSPAGLAYVEEFLSPEEEQAILGAIAALPMAPFTMKGVISKRLVLHFGWDYHYDEWRIMPAAPLPNFLIALREKAAHQFGEEPARFEEALINGYPPGAGIGWHRDAPMFGAPVIGVSLGSACRMRFRRKIGAGFEVFEQPLAPRSIYAMTGDARSLWQHMIPPTKGPRYSVTFRKLSRSTGVR